MHRKKSCLTYEAACIEGYHGGGQGTQHLLKGQCQEIFTLGFGMISTSAWLQQRCTTDWFQKFKLKLEERYQICHWINLFKSHKVVSILRIDVSIRNATYSMNMSGACGIHAHAWIYLLCTLWHVSISNATDSMYMWTCPGHMGYMRKPGAIYFVPCDKYL